MNDEQFRALCNVYGFAPSKALRELIDCVRAQEIEACALILDRNVEACINNSAIALVLEGNAMAIRARKDKQFCPRCGKRTNDIHTCTPP